MKFSRPSQSEPAPRRRVTPQSEESRQTDAAPFRRNQTLSSFRRPKTEEESHRQQLHHLATQRRRIGGVFLLIVAIIVVLGLLLTQFVAQLGVSSATTDITRPVDSARYEKSINEYYSRNPVERLRFILNQKGLTDFMNTAHPEIKSVALRNVTELVRAEFSLRFREPIAGWQINNKQYYVDSEGVVFEQNYFATPSLQIIDDSGVAPEQGATVASARLLGFVGQMAFRVGERGYTVTSVTLPSGTTRQLEVKVENSPTVIRVSIDRGAGEQAEDIDRALKYFSTNNITPQYVDVRIAGRAIYR